MLGLWAASLCGRVLLSLFIEESLAAESFFVASLLVLCAASLLVVVVEEDWASAGFAGVWAWAIRCGVVAELSSALGVVLLSGVVLLGAVALLSGVVVVVEVELVVVLLLLAPL